MMIELFFGDDDLDKIYVGIWRKWAKKDGEMENC